MLDNEKVLFEQWASAFMPFFQGSAKRDSRNDLPQQQTVKHLSLESIQVGTSLGACAQTGDQKVCLPALWGYMAASPIQNTHRSNLASFQSWELSAQISNQGGFLIYQARSSHGPFILHAFLLRQDLLAQTDLLLKATLKETFLLLLSVEHSYAWLNLAYSVLVVDPRASWMLGRHCPHWAVLLTQSYSSLWCLRPSLELRKHVQGNRPSGAPHSPKLCGEHSGIKVKRRFWKEFLWQLQENPYAFPSVELYQSPKAFDQCSFPFHLPLQIAVEVPSPWTAALRGPSRPGFC